MGRAICAGALALATLLFVGVIPAEAAGGPTITSTSQPAIGRGAHALIFVITGTGFTSGSVASVTGAGVFLKGLFVSGTIQVFTSATVSPTASTGARDLTVSNPGGAKATCHGCLTIDPAPVVTSIGSLEVGAGFPSVTPIPVTMTGSGFVPGLPKTFINDPAQPRFIRQWSTVVDSPTSATVQLIIQWGTTPGKFDVSFTNGDGGLGRCHACFTVLPGPVITSITPNIFVRGDLYHVTLTGQHFEQGLTVFVTALHGGIGITNVVVSADGTKLTFAMNVGAKVYLGNPIILLVRNPPPGVGSTAPMQLNVVKSCGTTTC
jgi:hypothetical protein